MSLHNDHCCNAQPTSLRRLTPPLSNTPPAGSSRLLLRIGNMDCPTEEALIRNRLASMAGIVALDFNLLQRQLS